VVISAIILGPVSRGISFAVLQGWNPDDIQWAAVNAFRMGHTQIDSFAIGCLLAITGFKRIKNHMRALILILLLMGVVYAFNRWLVVYQGDTFEAIGGNRKLEVWFFHNYQHLYVFTLINFVAAFFFMAFERGFNVAWLLNNRFMAYLGKISYGVYVYHVPILAFWLIFYFKTMPFKPGEASPFIHKILFEFLAFAGYWILLFLTSHLSFKYFEEYFLILKEKIDARKFAKLHEGTPKSD
jgi:peptidoglycan/LPS O-acetylase OafA/YrhL